MSKHQRESRKAFLFFFCLSLLSAFKKWFINVVRFETTDKSQGFTADFEMDGFDFTGILFEVGALVTSSVNSNQSINIDIIKISTLFNVEKR